MFSSSTVASFITQTVIVDLFAHSSGPFCTFKWTFLCILVDLLVQSSGPSLTGGGGGGGGVLQSLENPPWLRPCVLYASQQY